MELRVLRYFLTVAEERNMTRAAEKLLTSQSNLSHQIRALEAELGCKLFLPGRGNFNLTKQGLYLRKQARELLELAEKAQNTLQNFDSDVGGEVRIGGAETNAVHVIGKTIVRLRKQYPSITYYIGSGADYDIFDSLDRGLLDFGLVVPPVNKDKYNWLLLPIRDEIGFLIPRDHPLSERDCIRPEDLKDTPVQIGGDALRRQGAGTIWAEVAEQLNVSVRFNLVTNPALLLEDGVGVCLSLRNLMYESKDAPVVFRPLEPRLEMEAYLIWQKYQVMSHPAKLFFEELGRVIEEE